MTETPKISQPPSPWSDDRPDPGGRSPLLRRILWIIIAAGLLMFILVGVLSGYLVKWLWMRELDYSGIFWTLLSVQWTMFGSAFVLAFLFIWMNARWAISAGTAPPAARILNSLTALVAAGIALFGAAAFATEFNLPFSSLADTEAQFDRVRAACVQKGRDPGTLRLSAAQTVCCGANEAEVERRAANIGRKADELRAHGVAGTPDDVVARLQEFAAIGAESIYLQVLDLDDLEHIELLAEEVLPRVS